jgi:hypothetical protein
MKCIPFYIFFLAFNMAALFNGSALAEEALRFSGRWFEASSPWNTPIGKAENADYSDTAVQAFVEKGHVNMHEWNLFTSAAIYGNSAKDKTQNIVFKDVFGHMWKFPRVPIPQSLIDYAKYSAEKGDSDGMVCVKKDFTASGSPEPMELRFSSRPADLAPSTARDGLLMPCIRPCNILIRRHWDARSARIIAADLSVFPKFKPGV